MRLANNVSIQYTIFASLISFLFYFDKLRNSYLVKLYKKSRDISKGIFYNIVDDVLSI